MKSARRIVSLLVLAAILLAASPASAKILDRIVARVNNEIVTLHDVRQAAVPYMLQNGMDPSTLEDEETRDELYEEVLHHLIDTKLIVEQANQLDLEISDAELDQWLAFTRQQQGMSEEQFKQVIDQYGMKYSIYKEMVRKNLLKIRLVKTKVASQFSISEDEVDAEYRERFGELSGSEPTITVSHVLLIPKDESEAAIEDARRRAQQARKRIESGESFDKVAQEMSDGPTAPKGGELGTFGPGELDSEFQDVAFDLKVGEPSDVVQTKFGYHIILVSERGERSNPQVEQRRNRIHAELQQKTMERLLDEYTTQLRNRAFVEVNY